MQAEQSKELESTQRPTAQTTLGKSWEKILSSAEEVIDITGFKIDSMALKLMGDIWLEVRKTIRNAIALSLVQKVPSFIFSQITGSNFQDFNACMETMPYISVTFYACFAIVGSKIAFWVILSADAFSRLVCILWKYCLEIGKYCLEIGKNLRKPSQEDE